MAVKSKNKSKTKKMFPNIDYERLLPKLPIDNDGYVQSFDIIMDENDEKASQQNKQEIQEFFRKYGLVAIRNILNDKQLKLSQNETFQFIESKFDGFNRNNPNTWHKISGLSAQVGVISDYPIMSKQICLNRINPKLYKSYEYILNDSNLFTNIGRIGWMRPTKNIHFYSSKIEDRIEWKTVNAERWLHFDWDPITNHSQTYGMMPTNYHLKSDIDTYNKLRVQGILALDDCSINNGGFICLPGFHNILPFWMHKFGKNKLESMILNHRFTFDINDKIMNYMVKCPIRGGTLLIFNSKLPHANYPNDSGYCRMVQYIKYSRYDDPAVKPVKYGIKQKGPWDLIELNLKLPFDLDELNDLQKRIYGVGVEVNDNELVGKNKDNDSFSKFGIFIM
eukprot:405292_1